MTITIKFTNSTIEPTTFRVDRKWIANNFILNSVAFTGTNFEVFLPEDAIYKLYPIVYGSVPYIEEETPIDRTYVITMSDGRNFTQGWAE